MDFKDLIVARRSARGYAAAISREDLTQILDQARQAPSWKNSQTARCYVVQTAEAVEAIREGALPSFNQDSSAGAALIVTTFVRGCAGFSNAVADNEVGDGWGAYDLGLHDAYLVLAAANLGYDTLIMGLRDADALRARLNIPGNEAVMSVIAVGKRAKEPSPRPRKPLEETVRFF